MAFFGQQHVDGAAVGVREFDQARLVKGLGQFERIVVDQERTPEEPAPGRSFAAITLQSQGVLRFSPQWPRVFLGKDTCRHLLDMHLAEAMAPVEDVMPAETRVGIVLPCGSSGSRRRREMVAPLSRPAGLSPTPFSGTTRAE